MRPDRQWELAMDAVVDAHDAPRGLCGLLRGAEGQGQHRVDSVSQAAKAFARPGHRHDMVGHALGDERMGELHGYSRTPAKKHSALRIYLPRYALKRLVCCAGCHVNAWA